ncbi:hypothetical protein [Vibrio sp. ZF57]|uniref:hypothetical protein n=1 Tax=Vibrio sp. ZF57 TaxID=1840084 RepID=UPI00080DFBDE|nr:hypothetical protein [Vibrio sp. ZF57]OCH56556.1 hypothetical protein A6D97_00115 [Vibrio sp. ZF57]
MKHSATAAAEGFIYQFYEAVDWCHKLKEGQRLHIESFGDISINQDRNIEVKNVQDNLTDKDECFWKTLGNWLEPDFDESDYEKLILLTTQQVGPQSKFIDWNKKTDDEKFGIVEDIINKDKDDYEERIIKYKDNGEKGKKPSKNSQIERVRKSPDVHKLKSILSKFKIASSSPLINDRYKELCDLYCKGILKKNKIIYINSIIGFIISPKSRGDKWCITYEDFCKELSFLVQTFSSGSRVFPTNNSNISSDSYEEYLFIKKINEIPYPDVINSACKDYASSLKIIDGSFSSGEPKSRFDTYLNDVVNSFDTLYRKKSRRCSEEIEFESQDFYDDFTLTLPPSFPGYESTQTSFRNGVMHIQMDDLEANKKWRLK